MLTLGKGDTINNQFLDSKFSPQNTKNKKQNNNNKIKVLEFVNVDNYKIAVPAGKQGACEQVVEGSYDFGQNTIPKYKQENRIHHYQQKTKTKGRKNENRIHMGPKRAIRRSWTKKLNIISLAGFA